MGRLITLSQSILRHVRRKRGIATILVSLVVLVIWSVDGAHIISKLNPMLKRELSVAAHPALDVWITPPDYASISPTIISTPAGVRFQHDTIIIPQGSVISAHLAEQDGDAPELIVDGNSKEFVTDPHGDFAATAKLDAGNKLVIRRGWATLASWKIRVVPDNPPQVSLTDPPSITESKTVRLSYSASDEFGVTEVAVRITPRNPLPGANNDPVEIALSASPAKQISRVDFEDMTARPWAGQKVALQIVATNQAGKRTLSAPVDFVMPERSFFHPVARVLIEERKKLMQRPDDEALREETANIMAGIAHDTHVYHGDPVVMMALRSGAVRLILEQDHKAAISVNDLLWNAATRIEDGYSGTAQHMLRDARQDLADAILRHAGQDEIEALTERLQQALISYVTQLSAKQPKDQVQLHLSKNQ